MAKNSKKPTGRPRGQPSHKPGTTYGRRKDIQKILTPSEQRIVALIGGGKRVSEAAKEIGVTPAKIYKILDRPRVSAAIEKLAEKVVDKITEHGADQIVDSLLIADNRLTEIIKAPEHPFFGYKDVLTAIKLCYQRRGAIPKEPVVTAQAAVIVNQTQLTPTAEKAIRDGIGTYEPKWIREQYGINDPVSDAIDRSFGQSRQLPAVPVASSAGDVSEAVEAENGTAMGSTQ